MFVMSAPTGGVPVRSAKKRGTAALAGFTYPEMAFLLFVIALFVVGTVWVSSKAVTTSHPLGKSETVGKEAERAMDRIAFLVSSGRTFFYGKDSAKTTELQFVSEDLDFLADLDGDRNTGGFRVAGQLGFERVFIAAQGSDLTVMVYSSPGAVPRSVVLTGDMAPMNAKPFRVTLHAVRSAKQARGAAKEASEQLAVSEVDVRMTTASRGSRLVVSRTIATGWEPPLEPAP